MKLTPKEGKILAFINEHVAAMGYPPALKEIARACNISASGARLRIQSLMKRGVIRCEIRAARAATLSGMTRSVPDRETAGLPPGQRRVFEFLAEWVRARGYPPTLRELCMGLDLPHHSAVHAHLRALQRKGFLFREAGIPRGIRILPPPHHLN